MKLFKRAIWIFALLAAAACVKDNANPVLSGIKVSVDPSAAPGFESNGDYYRRFIADVYENENAETPLERKVAVYDNIVTDGSEFALPVLLSLDKGKYVTIWSDLILKGTDKDVFYGTENLGRISILGESVIEEKYAHALYGSAKIAGGKVGTIALHPVSTTLAVIAADNVNFTDKYGKDAAEKSKIRLVFDSRLKTVNAVTGKHTYLSEPESFLFPMSEAVTCAEGLKLAEKKVFNAGAGAALALKIEVLGENDEVLYSTEVQDAVFAEGGIVLCGSYLTGEEPAEPEPEPEPGEIETTLTGEGTEETPFLVASAADLLEMMRLVNGGQGLSCHFRQTADIMLVNNGADIMEKVCIGTVAYPFKGVYDGNGMKLSGKDGENVEKGLFVASASEEMGATALFGVLDGATVKNIRLTVNNQNKTELSVSSAGICAVAKGETVIENSECIVQNITCNGAYVGGVCGVVESGKLTVRGCKVTQMASNGVKANDAANEYVGAILACVNMGAAAEIVDCYNTAKIVQSVDEADAMGGICGGCKGTLLVRNCYTTASFGYGDNLAIDAAKALSGYIVGGDAAGVTVEDCFYVKPGGKKAQAKADNGAKVMNDKNWPAWDLESTFWGSLGAYSADSPVYPALDWEK